VKNRRGFTLLEVTLAAAIFAVAVVVLSSAFTNALTALSTMRHEEDDAPLFEFVRSHAITIPDLENFEEGERLPLPDDSQALWTALVEPTNIADLFKVELTITLQRTGRDDAVQIQQFYLLRPTWSDSDDRSKLIDEAKTRLSDERNSHL
jgi:general secretion pathway protein I